MTPERITGTDILTGLREQLRQRDQRELRLHRRVEELTTANEDLRAQVAALTDELERYRAPELARKYASEDERLAARRRNWRNSKRRTRAQGRAVAA